MLKATHNDKEHVIELLSASFDHNKSVNYIIAQDNFRGKRIRALMDYSFETCMKSGKVYLSNDRSACALILLPDKKKTTFASIWLDVKLIFQAIGFQGVYKTLKREAEIKKLQPQRPMYYLWFIGVDPAHQHRGIGTNFLRELMWDAGKMDREIYLETSTERNLPWYKQLGFIIYNQLDLGYEIYFLKQTPVT